MVHTCKILMPNTIKKELIWAHFDKFTVPSMSIKFRRDDLKLHTLKKINMKKKLTNKNSVIT